VKLKKGSAPSTFLRPFREGESQELPYKPGGVKKKVAKERGSAVCGKACFLKKKGGPGEEKNGEKKKKPCLGDARVV